MPAPERVEAYLQQLTLLDLTNYVSYDATEEELAAYGLDDPEVTVSVDYTKSGEMEEDDEDETARICHYDGASCLAVVDGESFALVPRRDVVDLIEAVHAIVLN